MEADGELETDALESAHQATVVATFDRYLQQALSANQRRRADYYSLSEGHRALLPGFNDLLKEVSAAQLEGRNGRVWIGADGILRMG